MYGMCPYIINWSDPTGSLHRAFPACIPTPMWVWLGLKSLKVFPLDKFHLQFYLLMQWARKLLKMWSLGHWVNAALGKTVPPSDSWRLLEQVFCRPLQVPQTSALSVLCPKGTSSPLLAEKQVSGEPALLSLLALLLPCGTLLLQHGISSTVCVLRAHSGKLLIAGGTQKGFRKEQAALPGFYLAMWAVIHPSPKTGKSWALGQLVWLGIPTYPGYVILEGDGDWRFILLWISMFWRSVYSIPEKQSSAPSATAHGVPMQPNVWPK